MVIPGKGNDMNDRTCVVDGCAKPTRSSGAEWCAMHYHRWYRHGDVNKVAHKSGITASLGRRYRTKYAPSHPLASKHGNVYVHRMVLFDEIGPGPHACHWCEAEVDWLPKGNPRSLQPDHLNGDGSDNRIDNLVPSCQPCNATRGSQARADALRAAGFWSGSDTIAKCKSQGRADRIEPAA